MRKLVRRLHFLLYRRRLECELAEEMAAHREMLAEDRRGAFGRDLALREEARDAWAWLWLDRLWQDFTYALRLFRRSPGFTLGAMAVLALGVGANLAELHVFDALLLHRLNIAGADTIFRFSRHSKDFGAYTFPWAAVEFYRENCTQCAFVVTENTGASLVVGSDTNMRSNFVSGNYFAALRILPAWGRLLNERDALPGAPAVAVLGYAYWQSKLAADPHVINRVVRVNGTPVQIVGVAPYDFDGLSTHNNTIWLPVNLRPRLVAGSPPLEGFARADEDLYARPKRGVSLAAVESQLTALTRQLAHHEPARFHPDERMEGERLPGSGVVMRKLKPAVLLMVFTVLLVLLSACANLGNMLLAHGLARQREIDIRIALGAGRRRVVRQLLTENLLLALLGSGAGLLFGYGAARFLLRALDAPPDIRIAMDWQILAAGGILTVISAIAFGLPPALQLARGNHKSGLRRQVLVGIQVAVSCLLLITSAVFAKRAIRIAGIDLRFDYRKMVVVYPRFAGRQLSPLIARQKLDALIARLEELPGVDTVTAAVAPPLGERLTMDTLPGLPAVYMNAVARSYFQAMKIPVVRGRTFAAGEQDAVIVSESAARAVWPNQDPIGRKWDIEKAPRTVVGVVKDSGANLMVDSESVEAYVPIDPAAMEGSALILHAKGDPSPLVRAISLVSAATGEPVSIALMRESREGMLDGYRKIMTVVGSLGTIATALAAVGMFALVAFAVAQRRREIGIRMAIGAGPHDILRALLAQNAAPVAMGALAGTLLSAVMGRLVQSANSTLGNALDPVGFAIGLGAFALIAILATLSPAFRALRVDPSSTLRCE
ncbi:MAG: ABC transporter permease [Acidobacteriota bacterium]